MGEGKGRWWGEREINCLGDVLQTSWAPASVSDSICFGNQSTQFGGFPAVFLCRAFYNLCEFPKTAITNDHKLGGLKTTEMYSLAVLEAGSLSPRFLHKL